jgi:DNA-directed RNA polymerase specialized sigma subunit
MYTYTEEEGLTAQEQYRMEIARLPKTTRSQEQALIEQARAGCLGARQKLIESCLRYVMGVASYYASLRPEEAVGDFMDVVATGNLSLARYIDAALASPNPCAYLRQAVRGAIIHHRIEQQNIIRVPYGSYRRGKRPPQVVSLDAPLFDESGVTLTDLVVA